jgi:hypothetical protein
MVEQRPDVRAAEANLHSASALVGVATANQFPNITLNASVATQALTVGTLFGPALPASVIAASVLQTLLDGGALRAKKRAAQAALEQADAQYRSTCSPPSASVADTLRASSTTALALSAAVAAEQATAASLQFARRRLDSATRPISSCLPPSCLSAGRALARAGAGGALHEYRRALPGAGRRLVEPRHDAAGSQGRTAAVPPPRPIAAQRVVEWGGQVRSSRRDSGKRSGSEFARIAS